MDVIATVVLAILLVLAAAAALFLSPFLSPFLLMATDSADEKADLTPLGWSYVVNWGAVAVGVAGAALGIYRAARHSDPTWIWPALGIVLIGAGFTIGGLLAIRVTRKSS